MAKVLISIDDGLLARVDEAARRRGLSRSAFVAQLAAASVDENRRPDPAARRAIARIRTLVAEHRDDIDTSIDTTTFIRRMRDER